MALRLKRACCGCVLSTGTEFIGVFKGLVDVAGIFYGINLLMTRRDSDKEVIRKLMFAYYIFLVSLYFFKVVLVVAIIIATMKMEVRFLKWLLGVLTVASFIGFNCDLFRMSFDPGTKSRLDIVLNLAVGIAYMALEIYFLLVVYSFYKQAKYAPQTEAPDP